MAEAYWGDRPSKLVFETFNLEYQTAELLQNHLPCQQLKATITKMVETFLPFQNDDSPTHFLPLPCLCPNSIDVWIRLVKKRFGS